MSNNKKFIVFLSWCSGITLVLSYIFSIVVFNNAYISNTFIFSVFSGIFASFCVMLLAEIKKYVDNKKQAEDILYATLLSMYVELATEIGNISMYLSNKNEFVPNELLCMRDHIISNLNLNLRNLDYNPFSKNAFVNSLGGFRKNEVPQIDKHIINHNYLKQAINLVQIDTLKQGRPAYNPTASDQLVETVLIKARTEAEVNKKAVEGLLNALVAQFPKRFNWENDKKVVDSLKFDLRERENNNDAYFTM